MKNLYLSILISMTVPILVFGIGDGMYVGFWYYFAVPLVILGVSAAFKLTSSFYTGVSTAIAISFIIYLNINWTAERPDGLLGLGHIFSLPGAFLLVMITAYLLKRKNNRLPAQNLILGFFSFALGFFLNQIVLCNSLIYCGILSFD
ncbi:MAG: hypothetical protein QG558_110 [Campylobacterota bacterium]|nr:hypothetical protein [Campylobacterota bacterium]